MTCAWCEKPMPADADKAYCSIHCDNRARWYGRRPNAYARAVRGEALRRQLAEDAAGMVLPSRAEVEDVKADVA